MKFGIRKPSTNKRIAARTSWKRVVRNNAAIPEIPMAQARQLSDWNLTSPIEGG